MQEPSCRDPPPPTVSGKRCLSTKLRKLQSREFHASRWGRECETALISLHRQGSQRHADDVKLMTSLSPRTAESEARRGAPMGETGSPAEAYTCGLRGGLSPSRLIRDSPTRSLVFLHDFGGWRVSYFRLPGSADTAVPTCESTPRFHSSERKMWLLAWVAGL